MINKIHCVSMKDISPEEVKIKMKELERHLLKRRMFVGQILTDKGIFSGKLKEGDSKIPEGQEQIEWVFMEYESEREYKICLHPEKF